MVEFVVDDFATIRIYTDQMETVLRSDTAAKRGAAAVWGKGSKTSGQNDGPFGPTGTETDLFPEKIQITFVKRIPRA